MRGLILVNAFLTGESRDAQVADLKREFGRLNVPVDVLPCGYFCQIGEDGALKNSLSKYDFCVFLDKDKYLSQILEKVGVRLFNHSRAIEICDDKVCTFIALSGHNIPMPKTLPGLLCFNKSCIIPEENVAKIEAEFGYPLIVKSSYGSLGSSIYKIDDRAHLVEIMEKLKCRPHLFQRYVGSSYGKDLRIIVIGGEMVCGYLRKNENDFRSNLALGGQGYKFEIPKEAQKIAEDAAQILGLDYCGVDILFDEDGFKLCEVNSNAYFEGSQKTTGVNIAEIYAKYILNAVQKRGNK